MEIIIFYLPRHLVIDGKKALWAVLLLSIFASLCYLSRVFIMDKIDTVVFDLGNVLIDWNPSYLFDPFFEKEPDKKDYFFKHICTMEWHTAQDAGRPVEQATSELIKKYPEWEHPIRAFYDRWPEMFHGPIEGSVQLLKELKEQNYNLYALTNWSAELFSLALKDFPFLHWFRGIVVSGEEKIVKPDPEIYRILLKRYSINPSRTIFIDDKAANIVAASQVGLVGIQFLSPEQLRKDLTKLGLLGFNSQAKA